MQIIIKLACCFPSKYTMDNLSLFRNGLLLTDANGGRDFIFIRRRRIRTVAIQTESLDVAVSCFQTVSVETAKSEITIRILLEITRKVSARCLFYLIRLHFVICIFVNILYLHEKTGIKALTREK
jgi:hypothetical protein